MLYNAATWRSENSDARRVERTDDQVGDGSSTRASSKSRRIRTFSLFNVGERISECALPEPSPTGTKIRFTYPEHALFALEAEVSIDSASNYPMLSCTLRPKADGWYSVRLHRLKAADTAHVTELWQPMIWQERRFPDRSYATLAFRCPVPSTFVTTDGVSRGIVAHPAEFPSIDPLPTAKGSRFCVALPHRRRQKPHRYSPPFRAVRSQKNGGRGHLSFQRSVIRLQRETRPTPYSVPPSASTPSATCAAMTFRRSTAPSPTSSATR